MKKLTPAQLGHRAAAQGDEITDCPAGFERDTTQWIAAHERVEEFRAKGLDPNGHGAPPPHLCARNNGSTVYIPKVCNCCSSCAQACRAEIGMVETPEPVAIDWPEVLGALPRIATALEQLVEIRRIK